MRLIEVGAICLIEVGATGVVAAGTVYVKSMV